MSTPISTDQLLEALHWRYAAKKFDPARKIPRETWQALEQSLVLAPSSMGMQPWKFFVVTDAAMKQRLLPAAKNQQQTVDCSHYVVFTVHRDLSDTHVNRHLDRMAEVRGLPRASLDKFLKMAMGNLDKARADGSLDIWQTHQVYIALGTFLTAAALLGVDTCPMEGIVPAAMDDVLGLTGTSFATVVACAAGYRAADDKYATTPKVRFKTDDVIVRI
jgi:nitroreductase